MMDYWQALKALFVEFNLHWTSHPWSDMAALCWLFVGIMSGIAVFYRGVRDTVLERIALAGICMGSLSRTFYVFDRGEIAMDGAWMAVALAFYCAVLWWKYVWIIPHRPDYKPPKDMPDY